MRVEQQETKEFMNWNLEQHGNGNVILLANFLCYSLFGCIAKYELLTDVLPILFVAVWICT